MIARGSTALALLLALSLAVPAAPVAAGTAGPRNLPVSAFTSDFSALRSLTALARTGKGKVGAILPDTVSATRYVELDQPDLTRALRAAGLKPSQFTVQNALGSDATELSEAQTDIAHGVTVLLLDPIDAGVGAEVERYARARGVPVIDYDRLTVGGSPAFYVGFDARAVGRLMGWGFVRCVTAWHVSRPDVAVLNGAATDPGAQLVALGYDSVIRPYFTRGKWTDAADLAGTDDPAAALAEFEAAEAAHPGINAAVVADDSTAAPVIAYLQSRHVRPRTFPVTGQGTDLTGLDDVLAGYQCGTIYEPVYAEAGAAVALALYLRAGLPPPTNLVNGTVTDTAANRAVRSVLLPAEWVTIRNMRSTVVRDGSVSSAALCAAPWTSDCMAAGIAP